MARSVKASHQGGSMGPIRAAHPPTTPTMIAYFKVSYSGTASPYTYSYTVAGYYNQSLANFIPKLLPTAPNPPGPPDISITTYGPDKLDFDLYYGCYVIFHLDPGLGWQYRFDDDGVETNDATPNEYYNLFLVNDVGASPAGTGTPPNPPVHIAYFAAKAGSVNGTSIPPRPDGFNLYAYIAGADETIDPDIKNTGRPPIGSHPPGT